MTNGQLSDLFEAWNYKQYLERKERAYMTSILANMWSKKRITVQDIVGVWLDGKIMNSEEVIASWKEKRRRRKEGLNNGEVTSEVRYRRKHKSS